MPACRIRPQSSIPRAPKAAFSDFSYCSYVMPGTTFRAQAADPLWQVDADMAAGNEYPAPGAQADTRRDSLHGGGGKSQSGQLNSL